MERTITALEAQKKNPNRVNVFLDEEFAFGLARIVAAWLQVGQTLTEQQIERLIAQDVSEVAFQAALRLLNYRARTEDEIRKRLTTKGFVEEVIEDTLRRLRDARLLDDPQFAQDWIENQTNFRPRGRRLLRLELRQKGVDEGIIEQALEGAQDEEELAYQAGLRPAHRIARLSWLEFRVKLSQSLARRGFSYDIIAPTVARLWKEVQTEAGDGQTEEND